MSAPRKMPELQTEPARYRHWRLAVDGRVARLAMQVEEEGALGEGISLKLNSYDLGVDVELRDALRRIRFEHPEVCCVVLESGREDVFCAGANIQTLAGATHPEKVNFCKYTNETRLEIEDAAGLGQTWIAALTGTASGGGYELALACERILLVDDRSSAVSLPEVALLAVLPGTGGLTRLVDKRCVRRDRADRFCTLAEGMRAPRALEWGLVDAAATPQRFDDLVQEEIEALIAAAPPVPNEAAVALEPLTAKDSEHGFEHSHVSVRVHAERRYVEIEVRPPRGDDDRARLVAGLALARELEDALLRLRFHHPEAGVWLLRTRGAAADVRAFDTSLAASGWLAGQVRSLFGRVLKQLDNSARSLFTLIEPGSCFVGPLFELALAADQSFMQDDPDAPCAIELGASNAGALPMANGLSRLETRFQGDPAALARVRAATGAHGAQDALKLGLVTAAPDELDYDDEVRVAVEERTHFSPDALTGMEANLRFVGPETLETKLFARLSAWQNWIFQRPNASGAEGALASYGEPGRPRFDWKRT